MKATLLGGWVRDYGLLRAVLGLAGVLSLFCACVDDASDTGVTMGGASDGASTGATTGGANSSATSGGTSATGGSTPGLDDDDAGMTTGGMTSGGMTPDGSMGGSTPGDIASTPGNDAPTATACTGTTTCSYATQTCCVGGIGDAMCVAGKQCPSGGLIPAAPTVCDGPEDCTGNKVCCVAVNPTGATNSCQASCDKVNGLIGVWQLCHDDGDCPAAKSACAADDTFPFWGFCG